MQTAEIDALVDDLIDFVESMAEQRGGFDYSAETYLDNKRAARAKLWGRDAAFLNRLRGTYGDELLALLRAYRNKGSEARG